jgi:hypothetical protein
MIASHMSPEEALDSLLFLEPETARSVRGLVPWKKLTLDLTIDSFRAAELVNQDSLEEILTLPHATRFSAHAASRRWRRVLGGRNAKKIVVGDLSHLEGVRLSPVLEYLGVRCRRYKDDSPENEVYEVNTLNTVLPPSVRTASLIFEKGVRWNFRLGINLRMIFPYLTSLELDPCPSDNVWRSLPPGYCAQIVNLSIGATSPVESDDALNAEAEDRFNLLSMFPNLRALRSNYLPVRRSSSLPNLHTFMAVWDSSTFYEGHIGHLRRIAPSLRNVSFCSPDVGGNLGTLFSNPAWSLDYVCLRNVENIVPCTVTRLGRLTTRIVMQSFTELVVDRAQVQLARVGVVEKSTKLLDNGLREWSIDFRQREDVPRGVTIGGFPFDYPKLMENNPSPSMRFI